MSGLGPINRNDDFARQGELSDQELASLRRLARAKRMPEIKEGTLPALIGTMILVLAPGILTGHGEWLMATLLLSPLIYWVVFRLVR